MRVLITGAGGFVGRHLVRELGDHGHEPVACDMMPDPGLPGVHAYRQVDVRDVAAVDAVVRELAPDACVHLAAITSVPEGASNPDLVLAVNVRGTLNMLHACRLHAPDCRFLFVSTAHVYGDTPRERPVDEDAPLRPLSMYAVSKAAADVAVLAAAGHYGIHAMTTRPGNHTGPGQEPRFVVAAFARQVREIARGKADPVMRVGNMESTRTFCDVRDVVRAYRLLLEKGRTGEAYNIASPGTTRVGDMLDVLCNLAGIAPRREEDPALMRPTDWSPNLAIGRLQERTGWQPAIPLEQTLRDMLDNV